MSYMPYGVLWAALELSGENGFIEFYREAMSFEFLGIFKIKL
jgi:hypothetical protein